MWSEFSDIVFYAVDSLLTFLGLPLDFSLSHLVFDFLLLFIPIAIFSGVIYVLFKLFMWGATIWE